MKSFYPKRLSKNWKIIWLLIQLLVLAVGYYLFVYNSYGYKSWNDLIGGTISVVAIIFILMSFIDSPNDHKWYEVKSLKFYIPSLLLALAIVYVLTFKRNEFYDQQASVSTLAEIIGKEQVQTFSRNKSNRIRTYATIRYFDNDQEIIQRISDYHGVYNVGQFVPIKYSENHPELFKIDFEYRE